MKPFTAFSLAFCLIASSSCVKETEPSYVGTWLYESSDPDLGSAYHDSTVYVARNGEYEFYDGGTGSRFSGDSNDFAHEWLTVTLSAHNDTEQRTYVATVRMLKGGKLVVETASVNGVLTLITFRKKAQ